MRWNQIGKRCGWTAVMAVASLLLPFSAVPANSAVPADYTATASLSASTATIGNPVIASVDFGRTFLSIESVGFSFTFEGDLLDPGDCLRITPLNVLPSMDGGGFCNGGATSQPTRAIGFPYDPYTSLFLDGHENNIEIAMESGSVNIDQLTVTVTGVAAPSAKDDCKEGGWQSFGVFKTQGDCISYVATGGKNEPAG